MRFNRKIWLSWKVRKPCPTCDIGTLNIPNKDKILQSETAESLEMNSYGGHYHSDYVFSMHLKCNNCGEIVVASGLKSEENYPSDEEVGIQRSITAMSFIPPPKIIEIPKSCPNSVKKILNDSFGLYWMDISSCANKIRIGIEVLLNELGVKQTKGNTTLTLHKRLKEFEKSEPKIAGFLLSIKWIGNAGSHFSNINKDDVLNAYELLEFALDKIYDDREQKLTKLSAEINKKKGK